MSNLFYIQGRASTYIQGYPTPDICISNTKENPWFKLTRETSRNESRWISRNGFVDESPAIRWLLLPLPINSKNIDDCRGMNFRKICYQFYILRVPVITVLKVPELKVVLRLIYAVLPLSIHCSCSGSFSLRGCCRNSLNLWFSLPLE